MAERITPDEDDAFITFIPRVGYSASMAGKARGWIETMDDAVRHVAAEMRESGFSPNVWEVNDHGNVTLLAVNADTAEWDYTETAYV